MNNVTEDCVELAAAHAADELFALLDAAHGIQGRLDAALDVIGLSAAKYSALDQLVRSPEPLTLSELAERLGCVRSNVTQLVDRLEADGLVERVSHPDDRRAIRAMVTPLGAERQAAGAEAIHAIRTELASRLTPEERDVFLRVLSLLR